MAVQIINNAALPIGKRIEINIAFSVAITPPTGLGISDITSSGFRVDVDPGPSGSTVMFEISTNNTTWTVLQNTTDDFVVVSGRTPATAYYIRAHYILNGAHSQYATANAVTGA